MGADGEPVDPDVEIEVRGLSVYTHHGVSDAEQQLGQRLQIDVSLEIPGNRAAATDRLEDTVDYSAVCDLVAATATESSHRTIERVGGLIAERLLERFPCRAVHVRVAKPEPPIALAVEEVAVEVSRSRAPDGGEAAG